MQPDSVRPVRMTIDKKFEALATEAARKLLDELPELGAVTVVVNWSKLPPWSADGMPAALWVPAAGAAVADELARTQPQLARALEMVMRSHFTVVANGAAHGPEHPADTHPKTTPDGDGGKAGSPET